MAAPSATARQTPAGIKMDEGHGTKITFARNPSISFWEKSVQPPGIDGGDAVETKTMFNTQWETMSPSVLMKMTEGKVTAAYDPNLYSSILQLININDVCTVRFPDGSTLAFWGYLQKFEPSELKSGEQPEADITIMPTNRDNSGVEQAPVLTSVSGT